MSSIWIYLWTREKNSDFHPEIWAGKAHCPFCEKESDVSLYSDTVSTGLIFIPFFTHTDDRYIRCDNCGEYKKISIAQFVRIKRQQKKAIKEKNYPREKILQQYDPAKFKWKGIYFKFFLSIALILFSLCMALFESLRFGDSGGFVALAIVCLIPLLLTSFRFVPVVKRINLFKKVNDDPYIFPSGAGVTRQDRTYLFQKEWEMKRKITVVPAYEKEYSQQKEVSSEGLGNIHNVPVLDESSSPQAVSVSDKANTSSQTVTVDTERFLRNHYAEKRWLPPKASLGLRIWFTLCAVFMVIPFSFLRHKDLFVYCKQIAGKRYKFFFAVVFLLVVAAVASLTQAIITKDEQYIILSFVFIIVSVPFTIINRIHMNRTSASLRTLKLTGNIVYIDEVLHHAKNRSSELLMEKHLMYDKPCRIILAYNDIVWGITTTDQNEKPLNYIFTIDGKRYPSSLDEYSLEQMTQKLSLLYGTTNENRAAYIKIVREYAIMHKQ